MLKPPIKLLLILSWLLFAYAFVWLAKKSGKKNIYNRACNLGSRGMCFLVGLRIKTIGQVGQQRPLLLVSNHISYLDVWVLGSNTPARFTPKSEVAGWPFVGSICRLLNSVFIERKAEKIKDSSEKLKAALAEGEVISLFAEGTTGNGKHLLPFKSSLFSIAEQETYGKDVFVQPAVICYERIGGLPVDMVNMPLLAWYGDMDLMPHLWQVLRLGKIDVTLTILPAVSCKELGRRKQIAAYLQEKTEEVLQLR